MKLVHFKKQKNEKLGIQTDEGILDIYRAATLLNMPAASTMEDLFVNSQYKLEQLEQLRKAVVEKKLKNVYFSEESVQFLPVVTKPGKIITINYNYLGHASELTEIVPTTLSIGSKLRNSLAAHNQNIPLPTFAEEYDYGAELVIVIGKKTKNVCTEDSPAAIFGYSIGNDLIARDLQEPSYLNVLGKSLDYFAPVGPYLVTRDEVNANELDIELKFNGETRQKNNTQNMLHNPAEIVSALSQYITLEPGDLIFTGTPEGVIGGKKLNNEAQWISAGDTIEITIDQIGTLKNTFF